MFQSPCDVAFSIFGYDIKFYGVMLFFALVVGVAVCFFVAKKHFKSEIDLNLLLDFLPILVLSAILGARVYYVLFNFEYFSRHLIEIPAVWHGGISIHGAILGGILAGIFYCRKHNISFLSYSDVISFGLVIGQAIGRWGNFFNSEAFGLPTELPWKLYIAPKFRPLDYYQFDFFHPTFLYESLWDILVFVILYKIILKFRSDKKGVIFFSYLILYSIGRFFIENLRIDSIFSIANLPLAQVVSILTFLAGVVGLIFSCKKSNKKALEN